MGSASGMYRTSPTMAQPSTCQSKYSHVKYSHDKYGHSRCSRRWHIPIHLDAPRRSVGAAGASVLARVRGRVRVRVGVGLRVRC